MSITIKQTLAKAIDNAYETPITLKKGIYDELTAIEYTRLTRCKELNMAVVLTDAADPENTVCISLESASAIFLLDAYRQILAQKRSALIDDYDMYCESAEQAMWAVDAVNVLALESEAERLYPENEVAIRSVFETLRDEFLENEEIILDFEKNSQTLYPNISIVDSFCGNTTEETDAIISIKVLKKGENACCFECKTIKSERYDMVIDNSNNLIYCSNNDRCTMTPADIILLEDWLSVLRDPQQNDRARDIRTLVTVLSKSWKIVNYDGKKDILYLTKHANVKQPEYPVIELFPDQGYFRGANLHESPVRFAAMFRRNATVHEDIKNDSALVSTYPDELEEIFKALDGTFYPKHLCITLLPTKRYLLYTWPNSQPFIGREDCHLILPPEDDTKGELDSAYMVPESTAEAVAKELEAQRLVIPLPEENTYYEIVENSAEGDYLDYNGNAFTEIHNN